MSPGEITGLATQSLGSWEWIKSMENHSEPVMTVIILVKSGRKWRKMSTQVLLIKQKSCCAALKDVQKMDAKSESKRK